MKKKILNSTIIAAFLATSSLAFAQPATGTPNQGSQVPQDRKEMMEKWRNMTPQERQAKFLEKSNERIDADLQSGIINKDDAKTLRAANKIVAEKILPAKEKEWKEKHNNVGNPPPPPSK